MLRENKKEEGMRKIAALADALEISNYFKLIDINGELRAVTNITLMPRISRLLLIPTSPVLTLLLALKVN